MPKLAFKLTDDDRAVKISVEMAGDTLADHIEAFRYALLGFGFQAKTLDEHHIITVADRP